MLAVTPNDGGGWLLTVEDRTINAVNFSAAIDVLDRRIRDKEIDPDSVILAGSRAVPWIVDEFLDAAEAAESGLIGPVMDAWARSSNTLRGTEHADALQIPWRKDA